jgi:hypothetical protein
VETPPHPKPSLRYGFDLSPQAAGESHMEIFDSFLAQNGSIGFESFVPKARTILKLSGEAFGKSYAIALPQAGRGEKAAST